MALAFHGMIRGAYLRSFTGFLQATSILLKDFGLGLSYVKMIAEEHHGYVEVESELYKGSAFKIFLPLQDNDNHAKD